MGAAPAPISFPSMVPSPLLPAPNLPSPSLPVNFPRELPGAWSHDSIELPAQPAVPVPQPAHDVYHLDWSFLDGGHDVAQLAYAADSVAHSIQAVEDALFDHALTHPRLTVK